MAIATCFGHGDRLLPWPQQAMLPWPKGVVVAMAEALSPALFDAVPRAACTPCRAIIQISDKKTSYGADFS